MTEEEFQAIFLIEFPNDSRYAVETSDFNGVGDVNWVTAGAVQVVKDQGRCGSCWAFAGVAVAESWKKLRAGTLGLFSD